MIDRELLVRALSIRRLEQARDDLTLCYDASTYNGEWARAEAGHLIRIVDRLQGADLLQGGGQ